MEFAVDATEDASLEYGANPARFDPSRLRSVVDFVYVIARRNLLDRLRAETALKHRESAYAKEHGAVAVPQMREPRSDIDLWAGILAVTTDPKERRATELWLDGAGTLSIAQALGYGHLPADGQRAEVKRFKDRLIKRLSRYFGPNR